MFRVAASLVCTKTVKVQPEEASVWSGPGHLMPATGHSLFPPPQLARQPPERRRVETKDQDKTQSVGSPKRVEIRVASWRRWTLREVLNGRKEERRLAAAK